MVKKNIKNLLSFVKRKGRVRNRLRANITIERPRLSVFRSNTHIYAQIIDDINGITLVAASTKDKALLDKLANGSNIEAAKQVGKLLAEKSKEKGIKSVMFDRGGYRFHGRVKALADSAREQGLNF